jgi:hypothetical protein
MTTRIKAIDAALACLEALKTVRAEAEKKANEIQRKINELLAIEHDSKEPL